MTASMFYRVILDCRPMRTTASQPFITIKFVDAEDQSAALSIAAERTKALMKEKGFDDSEIAAFEFTINEIDAFNPEAAALETERSFVYYSDG